MTREERGVSHNSEVESFIQENHLLKHNVVKLESELALNVSEVFSLKSRIADLEAQSSITSVEFSCITQDHDWYRRLLASLTHHFNSLQASLGRVVTEARAAKEIFGEVLTL